MEYVQSNKTPERCKWRLSEVFIVNFKHIYYLFLVFLLLTWSKYLFGGKDHNEKRLLAVLVLSLTYYFFVTDIELTSTYLVYYFNSLYLFVHFVLWQKRILYLILLKIYRKFCLHSSFNEYFPFILKKYVQNLSAVAGIHTKMFFQLTFLHEKSVYPPYFNVLYWKHPLF